ncbi:MAG: hypothetical protein ACHQ49_00080 [Elusimicrobiota bacterium]
MKTKLAFVMTLLCAGAVAGRAQVVGSGHAAWYARLGIERSTLTADQARRMDEFASRLEAAPNADAILQDVDRNELAAEGRSPDDSNWFAKTSGDWRLTDAGVKAVPGIVMKDSAAAAAPSVAVDEKALDLAMSASRMRITERLAQAGNADFDGAASPAGAEIPDAPSTVVALKPAAAAMPALAAKALPSVPQPKESPLEKDLFWSSWWGYHAAFVADFTTTGMVIGRGGYETDHLYTQFGNKNMAGVIGSAVGLHVIASVATLELHKRALKHHGFTRFAMEAAAIGIDSYGIGAHTQGAAHNVGVLKDWNAR